MYTPGEFPLEAIQAIKYSNAATLSALLWEACITFADEADFIWSSTRVRSSKAAYLVLRYYTLVALIVFQITWDEKICHAMLLCKVNHCGRWYLQVVSLHVVTVLQQYLMASRVYALYGGTQSMFRLLVLAFAAQQCVIMTCLGLTMHGITFAPLCEPLLLPAVVTGIGVAPVMYDALLLVLTLRACIRASPQGWRRTPLLALLFRDGIWAFFTVFAMFGVQGAFFLVVRGPLASVAWSWQFAACSCTAGRVVLHMHREARALEMHEAHTPSEAFALTTVAPEPDRGSEEW